MTKRLLVIYPESLSAILKKGEVAERYFNPGDCFDEVHILQPNDDNPGDMPDRLQRMVGRARYFLHNMPVPHKLVWRSLGWQPELMRDWGLEAARLADRIKPDLVRSYGFHLSAYLGAEIRRQRGVPHIISLHGNPDVDYLRGRLATSIKDRIFGLLQVRLEAYNMKNADHVIAVYTPIVPYLNKHRVASYSVIHNAVGHDAPVKENYAIDPSHIRLLCAARQVRGQKDPSNIIRAVADIDDAYLTLIGQGDLHDDLVKLARDLGCADRVIFIRNMLNADILRKMAESDMYVYCSDNYEISKGSIECALIGLPVIINDRDGDPATELVDAGFTLVRNDPDSYRDAILAMAQDHEGRPAKARKTREYARREWSPEIIEQKLKTLYESYVRP